MKIQCDVCNKSEASVYCTADEAALCSACDHRVHHANKLAGKHPRFSLQNPTKDSSSSPPAVVCDICQDKKALLFCQQDRAILCLDCDVAIHKVNPHTRHHDRFVLTGVKLSPTTTLPASTQNGVVVVPDKQLKQPAHVVSSQMMNQSTSVKSMINCQQESNGSGHGSTTTSSISEYLIQTLPGWHVEDFLDPPTKVVEDDPGSIWGGDLIDGSLNTSSFSSESMGIWVPQAPPPAARYAHALQQFESGSNIGFGDKTDNGSLVFGQYNYDKNITNGGTKGSSRKWVSADNGNSFMVPQISPSSTPFKRSRSVWQ